MLTEINTVLMEVVEPMRLAKDKRYRQARADLGKIRDAWVHGLVGAGDSEEKVAQLKADIARRLRTFKAKYDRNVQ